jgi:hypothetical protein
LNARGEVTKGEFTIDRTAMDVHTTGSTATDKSQFLFRADADSAVLKAASYAERHGLFVGNKATVYIKNGPIGVVGRTGQLTNYLRVYRTNTGFVHGSPVAGP